jgi:hypothetical protein
LKEKCGLGHESVSLAQGMLVGGLDILCVLPRSEMFQYDIPYVRSIIEFDIPEWEVEKWGIFWNYFVKSGFLFYPVGTSKMTKSGKLLK